MSICTRSAPCRLVLVLACLLVGCAAPRAAGKGVEPADAAELVESLVGLEPATPAAMQDHAALYARSRDAARQGSAVGWRLWLLLAQAALVHADAGTSEAFQSDLLPAWEAQPHVALEAMADNAWLLPVACWHLGRHFDFEGRGGAGREEFLAAHTTTFNQGLPAGLAAGCLAQIRQPRRPAVQQP